MRSHLRPQLSLVALSLSLFGAACADDAATPRATPSKRAPDRAPAPVAPGAPEAIAPHARHTAIHDVAGYVVDDAGVPVLGRSLVVVDARGRRLELMTDDGGMFHAMEVVPPYDVAIEAAPSGPVIVPSAYLGLRRANPRFELLEHDGSAEQAPSQTVRVALAAPPCSSGSCWLSVVTTSASGAGAASRTFDVSQGALVVPVTHAFRTDEVAESETIDVDVLSGDASFTELAYAHVGGVDALPGEVTDVAAAASAIATSGPVTVDAAGAAVPPAWEWSVATWLELPSGASMPLQYVSGAALVTRVPLVAGASLGAAAWAQRPEAQEGARRSAVAWSGPLDLGTARVRLDLHPGVELARPTDGGRLSRRGTGIAWSPSSSWAVTASLLDATDGKHVFVVHTAGSGISLRRLERLGIPLPALGPHVLDLTEHAATSVDDFVDERRAPSARPGASAYQRVRFVVTE
jgi:hypothetical protein